MERSIGSALGDTLNSWCRQAGISLTELADSSGVSRQYLHKLMAGKVAAPSVSLLYRIASALRMPPLLLYRHFEPVPQVRHGHAHGIWHAPHSTQDRVAFVSDHDLPDHAVTAVGARFTKQWTIQNIGTAPWRGRKLKRVDREVFLAERLGNGDLLPLAWLGLQCSHSEVLIPDTDSKRMATISIDFTAPGEPCTSASVWTVVNEHDEPCFSPNFFLQAIVTVVAI